MMVIVGAITRLTESGLSMVEWRPLIGFMPPLNEAEWTRVFDLYKQTPEFQKVNFWMGIEDFKKIFFWEWFHRVLGRLIGLAYGLPLLWFWLRGTIPQGFKPRLIGFLILGGLQGCMGWYMVKSGLVDEPSVSHYRLAAHLGLAFLIFSLLLKTALDLMPQKQTSPAPSPALKKHAWIALFFLILTIFWGAYTAGLDAGLIYNDTFPKMGETWLPYEMNLYQPYFVNFFENHAGVQFIHRWLAMLTTVVIVSFSVHAHIRKQAAWQTHALAGCVIVQLILGIATLMSQVDLTLAVLHQANALILLGLLVVNLQRLTFTPTKVKTG
jgi:cytochrome c oxidase assembly protein subunit 15